MNRALVVGTALLAVGCSSRAPSTKPNQPTATTAAAPGEDQVEFRDDKAGWAISYPKSWSRLESNDADVSLVVSEKPPGRNATGGSILARSITLGAAVGPDQLDAARQVTDKIVTSSEGVQLLAQPAPVNEGGLAGYFYFYSFKDPASGQEGAHSHYFLFKGSTMVSFVFQAIPKAEFPRLASTFDTVINSFRVL
jgi:hypothetical protein